MPALRPATVVVRLGVVLLVVGLGAIAWGGYAAATNPCTSGSPLSVDRFAPDETPPAGYERVDFADLPPAERPLFLEVVNGLGGTSRRYASSSALADLRHHVFSYRGDEYVTNTIVADCGPSPLEFFGPVGGDVSAVGLVVAVGSIVWRRRRPAT